MANAEHLAILKEGVERWNAWREENEDVQPDLREENLSGANLRGANLTRAMLTGADLREADLREAHLTGANLSRADLSRADLTGATLTGADLSRTVLQDSVLTDIIGLQSRQLAGADISGAKLPDYIGFEALGIVKEASQRASKLYISLLAACVYSWLILATTPDASLFTNSASTPLPIISTSIPMVPFFMAAPLLLLVVYLYFHLQMQRIWEKLGGLPAVFDDGEPLDNKIFPWLVTGLVRRHVEHLKKERPPYFSLQSWVVRLVTWASPHRARLPVDGRPLRRSYCLSPNKFGIFRKN